MASWGLAFEYGKKAYMDMMKKQEELDRYLAEHNLWEAQRIEQEEAQASQTAENRKARRGLAILNEYKDEITAGNDSAFVAALNKKAEGTNSKYVLEGKKVYRVTDGNKSLAYDLNSKELKNGSSRVAEFVKSYGLTSMDQYSKHEAGVKDTLDRKLEYDKLQTQKDVATINANGKIAAAGAKGGTTSKITDWKKEDVSLAASYAPSLVFGAGASGTRGEDGSWSVVNVDGSVRTLSAADVDKLDKAFTAIMQEAENRSKTHKADPSVTIPGAVLKVGKGLAVIKDYNDKVDAFNKDHASWVKEQAAYEAAVARSAVNEKAREALQSAGNDAADLIPEIELPELRAEPTFFDAKNNPTLEYKKSFLD